MSRLISVVEIFRPVVIQVVGVRDALCFLLHATFCMLKSAAGGLLKGVSMLG
jgi:hypothetical protein